MSEEKPLADIFKKVVSSGISAAFVGEEKLQGILSDLPIPKDLVDGLLQNAKNSKEEFIKGVKKELRDYLATVDLSNEIEKVLENYDFEITSKVSLVKKEKKVAVKKKSTKKKA